MEASPLYAEILMAKAACSSTPTDSISILRKQAEEVFLTHQNRLGQATIYLNKGLFNQDQMNDTYFEKAIQLYQQIPYPQGVQRANLRYGTFCIDKFFTTQNVDWWNRGTELLYQGLGENSSQICDALNRIGDAYAQRYLADEPSNHLLDSAYYYFNEAILYLSLIHI